MTIIRVLGAFLLLLASVPLATAAAATNEQPISAKGLSSHQCEDSEWHFVITGLNDGAAAPASIHVTWADGGSSDVSLGKVTGGTAHYSVTAHLESTVTAATASISGDWSGQFNLSHGPCGEPADEDAGDDNESASVEAAAPTVVESCGRGVAVVTITATAHVGYRLNGQAVAAGEHLVDADADGHYTAIVTATADAGYTLSGKDRWALSGTLNCGAGGGDGDGVTVYAKALTDHECDDSEWHFVITGLENEAQAPDSITVTFTGGLMETVVLEKVTGGTAHYRTTSHLDLAVTSATTTVAAGWSGQFNLSHGPCADGEETPTEVSAAAATVLESCAQGGALVTIPTTAHVTYTLNGTMVAAGQHLVAASPSGRYSVTVVATAETGYVLTGTTHWNLSGRLDCDTGSTTVVAQTPTVTVDCTAGGVLVAIPTTAHVTYALNGTTVAAGTHAVPAAVNGTFTVTVTATAATGYTLNGTSTFVFSGSLTCPTTPPPAGSAQVSISPQPCTGSSSASALVHIAVDAGTPAAAYTVSHSAAGGTPTTVGTFTLPHSGVRTADVAVTLVEDTPVRITVTSGASTLADATLTLNCVTATTGTGAAVAAGGSSAGGSGGSGASEDSDVLDTKAGNAPSTGGSPAGVLAQTGQQVPLGVLLATGAGMVMLGLMMLTRPLNVLAGLTAPQQGRHHRRR